jgi:hypothetical protein
MHLGFIDGPFVPHNIVLTEESPVSLLEFQMAPRLKISVFSGSKKGTQILFFCLKSPGIEPPPGSQAGPHIEREARLQGILHISQKPYLLGEGALPQGPPDGIPYREMPHH